MKRLRGPGKGEKVVPLRPDARRPARGPRQDRIGWLWWSLPVVLPALSLAATWWWYTPGEARRGEAGASASASASAPLALARQDRESARFARCNGPVRVTCVVDGDTIWYHGEKIRIADINTPEVSEPDCAAEAELGERATERLTWLLNAGPFTLQPIDRASDAYGRSLYVITRGGESLGAALVAEGLAEEWRGHRRDWCG